MVVRALDVERELVAGSSGRQDLAAGLLVERPGETAVRVEFVADQPVFEHAPLQRFAGRRSPGTARQNCKRIGGNGDRRNDAPVFDLGRKRAAGRIQHGETVPLRRQHDRIVLRDGERIDQRDGAGSGPAELPDRISCEPGGSFERFGVLAFGRLINLPDRRTRDDVMELIDQKSFPYPVQRLGRIFGKGQERMGEFDGRQQFLKLAVVALRAGLDGQRAAMEFEIQLAAPGRQLVAAGGDPLEKAIGAAEFYLRTAFEVRQALRALEILLLRPPPPSPMP